MGLKEQRRKKEMQKHRNKKSVCACGVLTGGSVSLMFEPSLTLGQVGAENRDVVGGQYEPSECTARQNVAILIPHRNREKHLLYLLHHLHPFLQRQQLHYAIYIIHQVTTQYTRSLDGTHCPDSRGWLLS